jgi:hypothetical protein
MVLSEEENARVAKAATALLETPGFAALRSALLLRARHHSPAKPRSGGALISRKRQLGANFADLTQLKRRDRCLHGRHQR